MSKVTKRKHVMKEMDTDFFDPPAPNQWIVRILCSRGNNLHEVESADQIPVTTTTVEGSEGAETSSIDKFLVSMPTKFRKNVWVKRGDFVIVDPIDEGDKVKGEIVRILTPQQIKQFRKDGIWPEKFNVKTDMKTNKTNESSSSDDDSNDDELFRNPNRRHQNVESDSSDGDDSDDESSDSD